MLARRSANKVGFREGTSEVIIWMPISEGLATWEVERLMGTDHYYVNMTGERDLSETL